MNRNKRSLFGSTPMGVRNYSHSYKMDSNMAVLGAAKKSDLNQVFLDKTLLNTFTSLDNPLKKNLGDTFENHKTDFNNKKIPKHQEINPEHKSQHNMKMDFTIFNAVTNFFSGIINNISNIMFHSTKEGDLDYSYEPYYDATGNFISCYELEKELYNCSIKSPSLISHNIMTDSDKSDLFFDSYDCAQTIVPVMEKSALLPLNLDESVCSLESITVNENMNARVTTEKSDLYSNCKKILNTEDIASKTMTNNELTVQNIDNITQAVEVASKFFQNAINERSTTIEIDCIHNSDENGDESFDEDCLDYLYEQNHRRKSKKNTRKSKKIKTKRRINDDMCFASELPRKSIIPSTCNTLNLSPIKFDEVKGCFDNHDELDDPFVIVFSDNCNERKRSLSECSDDSFIVCFEDENAGQNDCFTSEDVYDEFDQSDNESESTLDYSSDEDAPKCDYSRTLNDLTNEKLYEEKQTVHSTDEVDFTGNENRNRRAEAKKKKVTFDPRPPKVHVMRVWQFAARQARIGPWERMVLDRDRFRRRIADVEKSISWIFSPEHRDKVIARTNKQEMEKPKFNGDMLDKIGKIDEVTSFAKDFISKDDCMVR